MLAFATTPQLSSATSIPSTLHTLSSSRAWYLVVPLRYAVPAGALSGAYETHALLPFADDDLLSTSESFDYGSVRRLLEVLVDDEPHSRLSCSVGFIFGDRLYIQ